MRSLVELATLRSIGWRYKMERIRPLHPIIPRRDVRSMRQTCLVGATVRPDPDSVRTTATPCPVYAVRCSRLVQPSCHSTTLAPADSVTALIVFPSPRKLHGFSIPRRQAPRTVSNVRTRMMTQPQPIPRALPVTRLLPNGQAAHNHSFQIKQQHCEVCGGDAADTARLTQT